MQQSKSSRRQFVRDASVGAAVAGMFYHSELQAKTLLQAERPLTIGIMGCSRGTSYIKPSLSLPNIKIKYVCDADSTRAANAAKMVTDGGQTPTTVDDFRRILDDKEVDALFCAAPNHWHGPATILACKAGKHVYVEKPACHNPQEGEWMIDVANKTKRCVQVGTQRRSGPRMIEAIGKLHAGAIGKVYLARNYYQNIRPSIGKTEPTNPPAHINYDLWQGPAPKRPFKTNVVHYNWHWFWHWGNGELGNNGVHGLDLCRWGLQVGYPTKTVSSGIIALPGDDQETPDTHQVSWEFEDGKQITYQGVSRSNNAPGPFVSFYGTEGYMEVDSLGGHKIFDNRHKEIETQPGGSLGDLEHISNFYQAIRADDPKLLNQPIESGHKSTMLCLLGNVSHQMNRVLLTDPSTGHWPDQDIPKSMWQREYDPYWKDLIQG